MMRNKFVSAERAAAMIPDNATVGITGGGGGLVEPDTLLTAIENRFLADGKPQGLTALHMLGIGDRDYRGMNHLAHEGLVKRVIGGHWVWSPTMQQMAADEKIEAYILPSGVIAQLMREVGAGRPGLITHVGLGTFADPRLDGGKMNDRATEDLVEVIEIDGKEYLRYKPFPLDVALIRGSYADPDGNISMDQEPANLDTYPLAMAAHNSGGKVIVQVRVAVDRNDLPARSVRIPAALVDAVVVDPDQPVSHAAFYDPTLTGERRGPVPPLARQKFTERQAVAMRAAAELFDDAVINFGFGMPDAVAKLLAARGDVDRYYQTIEHGLFGGESLDGPLFGFVRNAVAMTDSPSQFDFYSGGGLDVAFLGMGEVDAKGNVNASKLGGLTVGPGGFVDIAQNARKVVYCGTMEAKGVDLECGGGRLVIRSHGKFRKFVRDVAQVTFSGPQAIRSGQEVVYVTERAVFRLSPEGVVLSEVAPGVDVRRDVLDRMEFEPLMPTEPKVMPAEYFTEPD